MLVRWGGGGWRGGMVGGKGPGRGREAWLFEGEGVGGDVVG